MVMLGQNARPSRRHGSHRLPPFNPPHLVARRWNQQQNRSAIFFTIPLVVYERIFFILSLRNLFQKVLRWNNQAWNFILLELSWEMLNKSLSPVIRKSPSPLCRERILVILKHPLIKRHGWDGKYVSLFSAIVEIFPVKRICSFVSFLESPEMTPSSSCSIARER